MAKINLEKEFHKIFKEYQQTVFEATEAALDKGSLLLQDKLAAASPVGDGPIHFKDSWDRKMQYKGVRYVGNTKRTDNDIPLSSIIEYSRNGHPFIQRTFNQNKNEIFQVIIEELGGKI